MDIYIRGIDEEIKVKLERQAKTKGLSLNKYLKIILEDYAVSPNIRNVDDKYKIFTEKTLMAFQEEMRKASEALEENSYILNKIEEILAESR